MTLSIPQELKKVTPFIKRAEELDKDKANAESRLVAYYCRQYAVSVGIAHATSTDGKQCLGNILESLETEKPAMSNFTMEESKFLCRAFADKIFDRADAEDRAGTATKSTARTFYAAATFFEILQQFYSSDSQVEVEDPENEEERNKQVYSKWKATEILKAIREGRQPTPGGYGDDKEEEEEQEELPENAEEILPAEKEQNSMQLPLPPIVHTVNEDSDVDEEQEEETEGNDPGTEVELLGPPPEYPTDLSQLSEVFIDARPPKIPKFSPLPPPVPPPPMPQEEKLKPAGFFAKLTKPALSIPSRVTNQEIEDAIELTKFALSALQSKDADLAANRLQQALGALGR